jgi:CCR4-NOT complex subunit CAF16
MSELAPAAGSVMEGGAAAAAPAAAAAAAEPEQTQTGVRAEKVNFFYANKIQALYDVNLVLPRGSRCLLVGDNGAGKTTLLKLLGGLTSTLHGRITVLDHPADFSPQLNFRRAYLGGEWGRRIVPFAGVTALTADIAVHEMMTKLQAEFPERRKLLFELLQIDPNWRMHQVSDGQRRRVQIMLNLLRPVDILFADEITTDLDVVTRLDLMAWLRRETEERGMTIVCVHSVRPQGACA